MSAFVARSTLLSHVSLAPTSNRLKTPSRLSLRGKHIHASAAAVDSCSLKSRLAAGETLLGHALLSFSPTLAEIIGLAGFDYVIIDMEHGEGGVQETLQCLRALDATGTPAIIRIPAVCPVWASKALDLGPAALMFPNVDSPAIAAAAVSYCRFPPRGVRGTAHPIVRASGYGLDDSYLSRCEDDTLIVCQVETAAAIAEVEAIAAVDGVDVVHTGPYDLAASMGYLGDPEHSEVRAKLREAETKVLGGRMAYLGGSSMPNDPPEQLRRRGYHMVLGAKDIALFRNAAVDRVKRFKEGMPHAVMENKDSTMMATTRVHDVVYSNVN